MDLSGNLIELFLATNLLAAVIPMGGRRAAASAYHRDRSIGPALRHGLAFQATLVAASRMVWTVVALIAAGGALSFAFALGRSTASMSPLLSALICWRGSFWQLHWLLNKIWPGFHFRRGFLPRQRDVF
jgi:hypothetical protein